VQESLDRSLTEPTVQPWIVCRLSKQSSITPLAAHPASGVLYCAGILRVCAGIMMPWAGAREGRETANDKDAS